MMDLVAKAMESFDDVKCTKVYHKVCTGPGILYTLTDTNYVATNLQQMRLGQFVLRLSGVPYLIHLPNPPQTHMIYTSMELITSIYTTLPPVLTSMYTALLQVNRKFMEVMDNNVFSDARFQYQGKTVMKTFYVKSGNCTSRVVHVLQCMHNTKLG